MFKVKKFGNPEKPVLVFLHGFMGGHWDWQNVVTLMEKDFYCILVDLPGHGDTPFKSFSKDNFHRLAQKLSDYLSNLNRPFSLLGYSLGGRLALYLDCHFDLPIKKLIIESSHPGLKSEKERSLRREKDLRLLKKIKTKKDFSRFLENWYEAPLFGPIKEHPGYLDMLSRRLKNSPGKMREVQGILGLGEQPNLRPKLKRGKTPILYLSGKEDTKYFKIGGQLGKDFSHINHYSFIGCHHNIHFEWPTQYAKVVKNFIQNSSPHPIFPYQQEG